MRRKLTRIIEKCFLQYISGTGLFPKLKLDTREPRSRVLYFEFDILDRRNCIYMILLQLIL